MKHTPDKLMKMANSMVLEGQFTTITKVLVGELFLVINKVMTGNISKGGKLVGIDVSA